MMDVLLLIVEEDERVRGRMRKAIEKEEKEEDLGWARASLINEQIISN